MVAVAGSFRSWGGFRGGAAWEVSQVGTTGKWVLEVKTWGLNWLLSLIGLSDDLVYRVIHRPAIRWVEIWGTGGSGCFPVRACRGLMWLSICLGAGFGGFGPSLSESES